MWYAFKVYFVYQKKKNIENMLNRGIKLKTKKQQRSVSDLVNFDSHFTYRNFIVTVTISLSK